MHGYNIMYIVITILTYRPHEHTDGAICIGVPVVVVCSSVAFIMSSMEDTTASAVSGPVAKGVEVEGGFVAFW